MSVPTRITARSSHPNRNRGNLLGGLPGLNVNDCFGIFRYSINSDIFCNEN